MADEYELVPVSPLEKLKKEIEEIKKLKEGLPTAELSDSLRDLADYVNKLVVIDADLHSRITDLMIKVTDLTKEVKVVSDLLRKALGEVPQQKEAKKEKPKSLSPIEEIERLREENAKLMNELSQIEKLYSERMTKERLRKALEKYEEAKR